MHLFLPQKDQTKLSTSAYTRGNSNICQHVCVCISKNVSYFHPPPSRGMLVIRLMPHASILQKCPYKFLRSGLRKSMDLFLCIQYSHKTLFFIDRHLKSCSAPTTRHQEICFLTNNRNCSLPEGCFNLGLYSRRLRALGSFSESLPDIKIIRQKCKLI